MGIKNKIVASGCIIISDGKLLVSNDGKDEFFKIPGGKVKEKESLEECALRELKEETGFEGKIISKLPTMKLNKKPGTEEDIKIFLYHFKSELKNFHGDFNSFEHNNHKVIWVPLDKIENYEVAPNIKFLSEKGELK